MKKSIVFLCVTIALVLYVFAEILLVYLDADLGVPHDYPNSEWISEDGVVSIRVIEEMDTYQAYASIRDGDKEREASIGYRSYGGGGYIMYVKENKPSFDKTSEIWTVKKFNETEFTVKVTHLENGVPIFEDNSLITFYRVDTVS